MLNMLVTGSDFLDVHALCIGCWATIEYAWINSGKITNYRVLNCGRGKILCVFTSFITIYLIIQKFVWIFKNSVLKNMQTNIDRAESNYIIIIQKCQVSFRCQFKGNNFWLTLYRSSHMLSFIKGINHKCLKH